MARNYENFDLEIRGGPDGYTLHVESPTGRITAPFDPPLTEQELKILGLTVVRGRRTRALASTREVDEVKAYGKRLFDGVFTADVLANYQASLGRLRADRETGLRIRLRLGNAPELAQVPWEYLYDEPNRRFLALEDETPVVRYLDLPLPAGPLEVEPPLRVLVMISSPSDIEQLKTDEEWARLNQALGDLIRAGHVRLDRLDNATVPGLRWTLKEGEFHVFHFIGHGGVDAHTGQGVLIFEGEDGRSDVVDAETVAGLLSAEGSLRLAVLNACEGGRASAGDIYAGTAQTLVQRDVPAVIAMQFEISDEAAIALTHDFYKALSFGDPVDAALTEARRGLRWEKRNELEWGTPVLYTRAADGRLFEVRGKATPPGPGSLPPVAPPDQAAASPAAVESAVAASRLPRDAARDRRVAELLHESQLAVYAERWGEAAARLEEILELDPEHEEAAARLEAVRREEQVATLFRTASEHQQAGRMDAALDCFRRVRQIDPEYRGVARRIKLIEQEQETKTRQAATLQRAATTRRRSRWGRWFAAAAVIAILLAAAATVGDWRPQDYDPAVDLESLIERLPVQQVLPEAGVPQPQPGTGGQPGQTAGQGSSGAAPLGTPALTPPRNRDAEAFQQGLAPAGAAITGRLAEDQDYVHDITLQAGRAYVLAGSCDGACSDMDLAVSEMGVVITSDEGLDAEPAVTVVVLTSGTYQLHVMMPGCTGTCEYRVQAYQ